MKYYDSDDVPVSRPVYLALQTVYMAFMGTLVLSGLTYGVSNWLSIRFAVETFAALLVLLLMVFAVLEGVGKIIDRIIDVFQTS